MKNDTVYCTMHVTRVSSESELRNIASSVRPYELREGSVFICEPSKNQGVKSAFVYTNGDFIRLINLELE